MKIIGIIAAYLALVLLVIMCLKPIFKILAKKNNLLRAINSFLVKYHKYMGILFVIFVIIHGIFSFTNTIKTYCAYIACVFAAISILFYFLRKKLKAKWLKLHLIFAIISLLFSILHIIEVNIYLPFLYGDNVNIDAPSNVLFDDKYKLIDGEYIGTGIGYDNMETKVSVLIENNVITDIKVISSSDDAFYIKKAEKSLKKHFIENQSSDVDVVSGATFSSNGYIAAVLEAVELAKEK